MSIKDSRKTSKRGRPSNNQLPTPSSRQASYGSQQLSLGTEIDQEPTQSVPDSEPLNLPCSSSEEFAELHNTWESSILSIQPTSPALTDNHGAVGLESSSGMHEVPKSSHSSTNAENIFDAALNIQAPYHHTNTPSQPARFNEITQERRSGWSSFPSTLSANRGASSKCDCLRDVALFLEAIGVESTEMRAEMLLNCVDRGI